MAKKRNKSKGKIKAKEKQAEVAKQQQKLLEEQIDALQIGDDSTRSNNDAAAADRGVEKNGNVKNDCKHGLPSLSMHKSASLKCMRTFTEEFNAATKRYGNVDRAYSEAFDAAKEYREVWRDSTQMKLIVSRFVAIGTQAILDGNDKAAHLNATLASHFEQCIAISLDKTQAAMNRSKMKELYDGDERTLVSFLRKRNHCTCLDEKYEQVKNETKMGICFNTHCCLINGKVERSSMMSCERCGEAHYCSETCQAVDWPNHKMNCDWFAQEKSQFEQGNGLFQ